VDCKCFTIRGLLIEDIFSLQYHDKEIVLKINYWSRVEGVFKKGKYMNISFILILTAANIGTLSVGFYLMKKFCCEEAREMRSYRRMTGLEIELLNKKIEDRNVRGSVT